MLTRTSLLVGVSVGDDGVPAEFKILSLLHVKASELLITSSVKAGHS